MKLLARYVINWGIVVPILLGAGGAGLTASASYLTTNQANWLGAAAAGLLAFAISFAAHVNVQAQIKQQIATLDTRSMSVPPRFDLPSRSTD